MSVENDASDSEQIIPAHSLVVKERPPRSR